MGFLVGFWTMVVHLKELIKLQNIGIDHALYRWNHATAESNNPQCESA